MRVAMTITELIERLKGCDPLARVAVPNNDGFIIAAESVREMEIPLFLKASETDTTCVVISFKTTQEQMKEDGAKL